MRKSRLIQHPAAWVAVGTAAWWVCFVLLVRWETWAPFALAGPLVAALAVATRAVPPRLLHPTLGTVGAGVAAGVVMVLGTHAAFGAAVRLVPALRPATMALYQAMRVAGASLGARMVLLPLIGASEEVIFRGVLRQTDEAGTRERIRRSVTGSGLLQLGAWAAVYGVTTATLSSGLLAAWAFACGLAWGWLRIASGSVVAPMAAHVLWSLGVLVWWPLV